MSSSEVKDFSLKDLSFFPPRDKESYAFYNKQESQKWIAKELDYNKDIGDWKRASENEKRIIEDILAFFQAADGAVNENITSRFLVEAETPQEKGFYGLQIYVETVHAETYGMLSKAFLEGDGRSINELIDKCNSSQYIKAKFNFMAKYMLAEEHKAIRFLAFACAEGIFFASLFATIFYFKSAGRFVNLVEANRLIQIDESLHRDFGIHMFFRYKEDIEAERVFDVIREAVAIEREFIKELLREPLGDLDVINMNGYVNQVANHLVVSLGYPKLFSNESHNLTWMDIGTISKVNFYERKVGNYSLYNSEVEDYDPLKLTGTSEDLNF